MKRYVPTTLDQYVNESNSITLRRGYGDKKPVVVGANAPIRNQVLSYVAEGQRVSSSDLKRFVAGLNETNANPNAAATMWLRRNGKFFITESRNGRTFFKLSTLGQRLVNRFSSEGINEGEKAKNDRKGFNAWVKDQRKKHDDWDEELGEVKGKDKYKKQLDKALKRFGINEAEVFGDTSKRPSSTFLSEKKKFDFKDPKTGEPGLHDEEDEGTKEVEEGCSKKNEAVDPGKKLKRNLGGKIDSKLHNSLTPEQDKNDGELDGFEKEISESRRKRIESIISKIKSINEEEEAEIDVEEISDEGGSDELSFDDLDLSGEGGEKGDQEGDQEGGEESEGEELDLEGGEEGEGEGEGESDVEVDDKVEITEFIITVDDVDAAIEELGELGVTASKVLSEGFINEADEAEEGEDLEAEGEEKEDEGEEDKEEGAEDEADADAEGEEDSDEDGEKYKDDEISVPADQWDELKGWLEDKGVDVEEMFGGEIEVEDEVEGGEDLDLDLEGGEGEEGEGEEISDEEMEMDLDLGGEGEGEGELDIEGEVDEVEENLTGMENHEKDTNNLIHGAKQVVINYK